MVRLLSLSLLTVFAGAAIASSIPEQQVLSDAAQFSPKWSYSNCGTENDPIQIKSIELFPDPPKPGRDLTVTVSGTAKEPIEEGAHANVVVKIGLVQLLRKDFDICKEARSANVSIQCPVEEGDHVVTHTVALPKEIPPAKFTVNVQGYTKEDVDTFCLKLEVDFKSFPFPGIW